MTTPTKILFLEIDAGDKVVIRRGAEEGWLPNLKKLLDRGLVGDTLAPREIFVGGIWPSFYTGVNPAKHGIHSLTQLRTGSYEFYRCYTGENVKRTPFWSFLSRGGQRVAVLDIPLSGITKEINGIQSVEWGSHDENYGFCAWPKSFEEDVLSRFGRHPLDVSCNDHGNRAEDFIALRDKLLQGVKTKSKLTRHYLGQGGWDFFAQVFTESHCIGHQCWHLHDSEHPGHDPAMTAVAGDPLQEVYRAIDAAVGEIVDSVGPETTIIVLAGHRMAHKFGAQFLLPDILVALGVAKKPRVPTSTAAVGRLDGMLTACWQRLPATLKSPLNGVRQRLRNAIDDVVPQPTLPPHLRTLDLPRSKCFLMDNGFPVSGLRVNLVNREPNGLIERGADMDRFCSELAADLLDLRDADTDTLVVKAVKRTADHYQGEYLDDLPDLLVEWDDRKPLGSATCGNPAGSHVRIRSDKIGIVEGVNTYIRTGDHRPEGLFVATGPGIRAGQLGRTVSTMDFAPTFCALLGTELPDPDGTPIAEIITASAPQALSDIIDSDTYGVSS